MITLSTLFLSFLAGSAVFFLALPLAGLASLIGIPLLILGALGVGAVVIGGVVIGIPAILLIVYFVFGNGLDGLGFAQPLLDLLPGAGAWLASFLPL